MTEPKIVVIEQPDPQLREAILRPLVDYNASKVGPANASTLAILIRDSESDAIIGGIWARIAYDWLSLDLVVVPEVLRGRGLGGRLMGRVEAVAEAHGCVGVWLDTFSFQARGFYEKLGYELFGTLDNYPGNESRFFLSKRLPTGRF